MWPGWCQWSCRCLRRSETRTAVRPPATSVDRHCRTLPLWSSAMPSRFRTRRTDCRARCPSSGWGWLQEPVAGLAAAGGMQPAPMDANNPGGKAAAELATDIGHRWPGERAGLLEAEVVDLQPGHLAVLPAADDRLGDLVGDDAELGPGVLGPGAQLTGEVGHKHQLAGLAFWVAGEQPVDQAASRLGNTRVQQPSWGDDQHCADLKLAGGS